VETESHTFMGLDDYVCSCKSALYMRRLNKLASAESDRLPVSCDHDLWGPMATYILSFFSMQSSKREVKL
jgi:hypothetical protein